MGDPVDVLDEDIDEVDVFVLVVVCVIRPEPVIVLDIKPLAVRRGDVVDVLLAKVDRVLVLVEVAVFVENIDLVEAREGPGE